jgi:hypothetical protein
MKCRKNSEFVSDSTDSASFRNISADWTGIVLVDGLYKTLDLFSTYFQLSDVRQS